MPAPQCQQRHRATLAPRLNRISLAALGLLTLPAAVLAQQGAQAEATNRIEITGSIIRRSINAETSLPVTSIKAEELQARGHTELKDFMLELPQANSRAATRARPGR